VGYQVNQVSSGDATAILFSYQRSPSYSGRPPQGR